MVYSGIPFHVTVVPTVVPSGTTWYYVVLRLHEKVSHCTRKFVIRIRLISELIISFADIFGLFKLAYSSLF